MITENLKHLIQILTVKTTEKKAIWTKASGDKQFKLSINDGIAITVAEYNRNITNGTYHVVNVFNSNGDVIERLDTEDFNYSIAENDLITSFYKSASDSYYKVEETIDALIASVTSQDIVGKDDEERGQFIAPDEDDLPF